jgi:hypothetical protein
MANTNITFTWFDATANTEDLYVHEMTTEDMDRIIEAGRRIFGTMNAETMTLELASRNKSRKSMSKEALRLWKERARQEEIIVAQDGVAANIPPIESTEL